MNSDAKIFNEILTNQIQDHIKKIIYLDRVGFIPKMQGWFNIWKSVNVIHHIKELKDKTLYDHLIRCGESLWQNRTHLHDKSLGEIRNTGHTPKHRKGNLQQAYSQHQIKWRGTQSNSTKIRNKTRLPAPCISLFNIVLGVLARAIRQLKEIKKTQIMKQEVEVLLFKDDMIVYISNLKSSTRELLHQ